ncbi:tape measure protein [Metapseudomonas otitidis]|uniref:tape measure protein n=1 Tax=Metapseudomonas otitidis TaxID=319939 RepID=UPI001AAF310B|nr:tape measure protein [Pseudomonas otitidis]MBO2926015.1 tape measure protein [Pseudomonas otitidis]
MTTEIEFRLKADLDSAVKEVAGFRKEYAELVLAIEKPLRQVKSFRELESGVEAMGKATAEAKARVRELGAELIRTEYPSEQLQNAYRVATAELRKLQYQEAVQTDRLRAMRTELKAAGVDTTNLALEQRRLSQELSAGLSAGRMDAARTGIRALAAEQKRLQVVQRQNSIEAARANLGVTQARSAEQAIAQLRRQYELLRASGTLSTRELAIAQEQLRRKIAQSKQELSDLRGTGGASKGLPGLSRLPRAGLALGAVSAIAGVAVIAAEYAKALDPIKKMDAQLRLATDSQEQFARAQRETFRLAQDNKAPLEDVVTLYARLAPALKEAGRGQGDAVKIIDAVTKSLRISGASAEETASTIQQFSQALGSGVLRGEEFNTLAESSPRLLKALADGLNVNVGALRDMAAEGKLTATVIADSLIGQLPKLASEAAMLPETYAGAVTKFQNETKLLTKSLDELTGASDLVVGGLSNLTAIVSQMRTGQFADYFRSQAQSVGGINTEMSILLSRIRDLQTLRAGLSRTDPSDTVFFKFKFYTRAELDAEISALEADLTGMREQLKKIGEGVNSDAAALNEEYLAGMRKRRAREEADRAAFVKDLENSIKAQEKLERDALTKVGKLRDERADIEKKYADAQTKLGSISGNSPSYAAAQGLKVSARQALQSGDFATAKRQADEALKVILAIQEAGGNTFGLSGFAAELEKIELAANGLEKAKAEESLDEIRSKIFDLQQGLDRLKNVQITVSMSDEEASKVLAQMEELAAQAGEIFKFQLRPLVAGTDQQQAMALQGDASVKFPTQSEATKKEAIKLGDQVSKDMVVEPQLEKPEAFRDGTSFTQFPPTQVTPELNAEASGVVQSQIAALAQKFQQQLTVPVTPVLDNSSKYFVSKDGTSFSQFPDGFATGGWTGPGGKYTPVGVVHADEHVQPKEVVNEPGALSFLEQVRRNGFRNTMATLAARMRNGYADGGLVTSRAMPSIPLMSPGDLVAPPAASFPNLGLLEISVGGAPPIRTYAEPSMAEQLRRTAMKFGRP